MNTYEKTGGRGPIFDRFYLLIQQLVKQEAPWTETG
jgi:hypothetical protein